MSGLRINIIGKLDRLIAVLFASIVVGTALAFGGMAWWGRFFLAGSTFALCLTWFLRCGVAGRWPILFSPLTMLGTLALALGIVQLLPWPGSLASIASPNARAAHALGTLPELAKADDPSAVLPEPFTERSPLTLDRSATLRWVVGASACLALFWTASHFTNRLGRLSLIWGCVVAAFLLNGAFVAVQLAGGADGLLGFVEPGSGPRWAPSKADATSLPGRVAYAPIPTSADVPRRWLFPKPLARFQLGTLPGGSEAFLALGSLGLPLSLALALQMMASRGSREPMWARLSQTGKGSLLILLYGSTLLNAFLIGLLAGKATALPFLVGIGLIGVPSLFGTGLGFKGFILSGLAAGLMVLGVWLGDSWETLFGASGAPPRIEGRSLTEMWSALPILKDFPLVGVGFGAYPTIAPYYKPGASFGTTADGSLVQWATESGLVGLAILALAGFWCLVRLPVAIARVGSADRSLAFGFVGALVCFVWYSTFRWSVELTAVAAAASVFAGTMNRWLAGGTDLLVEPA